MKMLFRIAIAIVLTGFLAPSAQAQDICANWNNSPKKEEAENAHSIYRQYVKGKQAAELQQLDAENFKIAFDHWKKAYDIAPAANGQTALHYSDGRLLYQAMYNREQDAAKKKEYAANILRLYDEQMNCFKNEAFLLGRKGYDMFFYLPEYGLSKQTYDVFKASLEKGGNATEYIVFDPLGQLLVHLYKNKQVDKQEVITINDKLNAIAEHNIKSNKQYGEYYKSGQGVLDNHLLEIADQVFDCDYFKKQLMPNFEKNPNDLDVVKYVYNKLRQQGCDSTDASMAQLRTKYEVLAKAINDSLEQVLRTSNPGYYAALLQQDGKYSEAIEKYKEAIEKETDNDKKAQFYYSIASIQTYQFSQYNAARDNARKAASLKSNWGRPYILIGDMYARTSRDCGDDWNTRLAILAALEKWAYAKSIDSDVSGDANERIGRYAGSKPDKAEGHMRGVGPGDSAKVGCWIGETVRVSFAN
jgi:uncharacterized protein YjbJ (UPF0337 family)